jgi:ferric-dicitrate binding protein FerR (iron transport regulator)
MTEPWPYQALAARKPSSTPQRNRLGAIAVIAASMLLATTLSVRGQAGACQLVPDDRNPSEKMLRCGDALVVRQAVDANGHVAIPLGTGQPNEVGLDGGALMIEFHPTKEHPTFQIRTPYAIAAVRGTKWIVDVGPAKASTFVIAGVVAVSRPGAAQTALLHAGEGSDVFPDSGPIVLKRWPAQRVRALLARFGQ